MVGELLVMWSILSSYWELMVSRMPFVLAEGRQVLPCEAEPLQQTIRCRVILTTAAQQRYMAWKWYFFDVDGGKSRSLSMQVWSVYVAIGFPR